MKPFVKFHSKQTRRRTRSTSPWSCVLERLEERRLLVASITAPAAVATLEDTAKAITGISFTSTAATDTITVTLTVTSGTITISSSVTNGLSAQITNNGTASVTVSASVTVTNLTFASASGVIYTPNANFNGPDTLNLHLVNNSSETADSPIALTITAVNDAPSFTLPDNRNQLVAAIAPLAKTVPGFATNIKTGPTADEAGQIPLTFVVTNNNGALFSSAPAIDATTGDLTYTLNPLAANTSGVATVTVKLQDTGGTANSGSNTSAAQTFTITAFGPVNPVYNSVAGSKLRAFVVNGVLVVQANGIPFVSYPSAAIESLTFNGGAKNDEIDLSGVTSALFPNLGTVKIKGGAGNDRIVGSYQADSIDAGSGNDTLTGGDDTLIGNAGTDLLVETANTDLTLDDTSLTGLGTDKLVTIEKASLTTDDGGRTIDSGAFTRGAVTLTGGAGDDTLTGGSKNDAITGRDGNDVLAGGEGNDTVLGGFGDDDLSGDDGNDLLIGGFDVDTIHGGNGRDTVAGGQGGAVRGGNGVADVGDDTVGADNEVINETFKKLFAFE